MTFGSSRDHFRSLSQWLPSILSSISYELMQSSKRSNRRRWYGKHMSIGLVILLGFFLCMDWWLLSGIREPSSDYGSIKVKYLKGNSSKVFIREDLGKLGRRKPRKTAYARLLAKAAHALAEGDTKSEPPDLWTEPYATASLWVPCAHTRNSEFGDSKNGYIMITANGGINQQRVAVCNAVAIARLLNAILVLPKFMFSSVWRDASQFGDIYQEDHFINYLMPDVTIVKALPEELASLDLEAIESVVTDADIMKEAKPSFYLKYILPILQRNKVVHFVGFGNRLASDPVPFELQRLRCRCNFHALRFAPKIQEAGALLIQRMRQNGTNFGYLDSHLVGPFAQPVRDGHKVHHVAKTSRYLSVHLRFEIDMVAHSLCEFGGGEEEKQELDAYRKLHFPSLVNLTRTKRFPRPAQLKSEGLCPLMPEETVLMLAALGFNRRTHIYLAGSHIYGGESRLAALTTLYPNLVTKEKLLSPAEFKPFANFSSQLASLDFIASAAADVFAITDPGSQFSSLIGGYRIYFGQGKMPTIRPNKRRLADIFAKNNTIEWKVFEKRVQKAVRQNKRVFSRPVGRSVYRYPRCQECMCFNQT